MVEEKKKRLTKRGLPAELRLAIEAGLDKKAEGLCVLDLRELCSFTDFFLVTQGNSSRQNSAISDWIEAKLKAAGTRPLSVEGRGDRRMGPDGLRELPGPHLHAEVPGVLFPGKTLGETPPASTFDLLGVRS